MPPRRRDRQAHGVRTSRIGSKGHRCFLGVLLQKFGRPGVGCALGDPGRIYSTAQVSSAGGLGGRGREFCESTNNV